MRSEDMKFKSLKEACEWINKTGWLYKKGNKRNEYTKKYK